MRAAAIVILASLVLVACSGSDPSDSPASSISSPTPTPVETPTPTPSPSSEGFCVDRAVIGDVYRLMRAGAVPYRQAAAFVTAAGKVMRADVESASGVDARKLRQFVIYLNTLRLAILGAAANYPGDFAVRQFTNGLVDSVQDLSSALDCPT